MNADLITGILLILVHAAAAVDVYLRVGIKAGGTLHGWVTRSIMAMAVIGLWVGLSQVDLDVENRSLMTIQVIPPALILIGIARTLWSVRTSTIISYVVAVPIVLLNLLGALQVGPETDTIVISIFLRATLALLAIGHLGFAALQSMRVASGRNRAATYMAIIAACALFSYPVWPYVTSSLVVDVLATSLLWFSVRRAAAQNA